MKEINGKDIILQRLEGNAIEKRLKLIDSEVKSRIIDLNSKKILEYKNGKSFEFVQQKKDDLKTIIIDDLEKPNWISETSFSKIKKAEGLNQEKLIEREIELYDKRTNDFYLSFLNMANKNKNFVNDKAENALFVVDYLIYGKLLNGTEVRFPFSLTKAKINIDSQNKKIRITKDSEMYPNKPFIFWLGNMLNIEVQSDLDNLDILNKDNFIDAQLNLYKKLGINLKQEEFQDAINGNAIFKAENKSAHDDYEKAEKFAKHIILSMHYSIDIMQIDINWIDDYYGKLFYQNDEINSQWDYIEFLIAPWTNEELESFLSSPNESFDLLDHNLLNILSELSNELEVKKKILVDAFAKKEQILEKYSQKLNNYLQLLLTYRTLDEEQIQEQWVTEELCKFNQKETKTLKFEKGVFSIEKVNLLIYTESFTSNKIYSDVKKIFSTDYIENLIDTSQKEDIDFSAFDESEIYWGFRSDIHQQKAVWAANLVNTLVIQGPPGTGKTQTILNIISNNVLTNKRTLVVSDKITALEVIYERLIESSPQLVDFVMDLYNINKGIHFYNELANVVNASEKEYNLKNAAFSSKQIVDRNNNLSKQISSLKNDKDIDLLSKHYDEKDIEFVKQHFNFVDVLDKYVSNEYYEYLEWKKQKQKNIEYEKTLPFGLNRTNLKDVLEYEKPYSEITKLNFVSILVFNKPKFPFYKKRRLKKATNLIAFLDNIFATRNENFNDFKNYIDFNFDQYPHEIIEEIEIYGKFLENDISFEKTKQINTFLALKEKTKQIKSELSFIPLNFFYDINAVTVTSTNLHKLIAHQNQKNLLFLNKFSRFSMDLERMKTRQKVTKFVREFIKTNWNKLFQIFPVVMATPEIVSEYLPLVEKQFDTVIIDEASQLLIENALPSIFRSKQIIISGDKQQLRPTIKGQRYSSFADYDSNFKNRELIENESILDFYSSILNTSNTVMLKTHYRSEKTELIKYSSEHFYDNQLKFIEKKDFVFEKAIDVYDVPGKWENQKNVIEAEKIVEILNDLVSEGKKSIGVILFSKKQAKVVLDCFYKSGSKEALEIFDNSNNIFIKSIDQVQGEEREIIIFGIGYGLNVSNYGFLSRVYGENRINVAASRAKQKIIIVKSHKANEFHIPATISKGPKALINFIKYCENYEINRQKNVEMNNMINDFIEFLIKKHSFERKAIQIINSLDDFWFLVHGEDAYYLIDEEMIANSREGLWFYDSLLKARGFSPKGISSFEMNEIFMRN